MAGTADFGVIIANEADTTLKARDKLRVVALDIRDACVW